MKLLFSFLPLLGLLQVSFAAPANVKKATPTVTISSPAATVIGASESGVDKFNAIPFAQPPTHSLRLKPPQPLESPLGTVKATGSAKSCPQFLFSTNPADFLGSLLGKLVNNPLLQLAANAGEDCLTLDIRRPSGTTAEDKLPVLVWIFGGGFELGSTSMYDGGSLVTNSVGMDMPIVFVAINYRVGGFGFMPGKEILEDGSSNLGLLDQRLALQWVADNIADFGGDPEKVTIWGESAGSISVFDQLILYDGDLNYKGKPLVRGAIMDSGGVVPADPVDCPKGQAVYDAVVDYAGCSSAVDTLECLRALKYEDFLNAATAVPGILSYNSVALSYLPRPDGTVVTKSPELLVKAGKYARVPFIIGDQEDEGTLFAIFQSNITTTDHLVDYFEKLFFHGATRDQIKELVATYPDTTEYGSPFRTGNSNNLYPQFKRLAAMLGDLTFTLTRRALLQYAAEIFPDVPTWSYLASYSYGTPIMGTSHGSDIQQVFFGSPANYAAQSIQRYYLSFVYDLDPNSRRDTFAEWPQWAEDRQLVQFFANSSALLKDDFRSETYNFLLENMGSFHI